MYKILNNSSGAIIGLTDNIRYIAYDDASGTFLRAVGAHDADGIAFGGTPYNIGNTEKIPNADFVSVIEVDSGYEIAQNIADISEMNSAIDDIVVTLLEV